jgi:hypothetical protein
MGVETATIFQQRGTMKAGRRNRGVANCRDGSIASGFFSIPPTFPVGKRSPAVSEKKSLADFRSRVVTIPTPTRNIRHPFSRDQTDGQIT